MRPGWNMRCGFIWEGRWRFWWHCAGRRPRWSETLWRRPWPLPPVAAFLLWSAAVSGVTGLPLLLVGVQAAGSAGPAVMALGGAVLLMAGAAQLRLGGGLRSAHAAGRGDALLAGLARGVSVVPGFSRSGLTTAALLARGFRGRDALALSFLMSVPAGRGVVRRGERRGRRVVVGVAGGAERRLRVGVADRRSAVAFGGAFELRLDGVGGGRVVAVGFGVASLGMKTLAGVAVYNGNRSFSRGWRWLDGRY